MDTAQWPQGIGLVKPMDHHNHHHHHHHEHQEEISANRAIGGERRATRPQEQLNCPRCNSTNTKFCYYNNYSLTQPRYFCKGCRRYWTEGGSLRNVPVGGGSRKNKRSTTTNTTTTTSSSSTPTLFKLPDLNPPRLHLHHQNPSETHQGQDLNLSFQEHHHNHHGSFLDQLPKMENREQQESNNNQLLQNPNSSSTSALDLLRTGIASRGLSSFIPQSMPDSNTIYSSSNGGFTLQEYKPMGQDHHSGGGRLFFPFGDFSKQISEADQQKGQPTNRYWTNGMLGNGGGSW